MTRTWIATLAAACLASACNKTPETSTPAPIASAATAAPQQSAPAQATPAAPAPAPDANAQTMTKKELDELVKAGQDVAKADDAAGLRPYTEAINQFDPKAQNFIWVLPEGVHGKRPWTMHVTIKEKGEVKYESSFPLKDEIVRASTFPQLPPKSEVVRLSDDGSWTAHMGEVKTKIDELVAQYGHGNGELVMESQLHTTIDDAHQKMYCKDGVKPLVRFYMEEAATKKLTQFSFGPLAPLIEKTILKGCKA